MPWPEPQRRAIFLDIKRGEGERAAREFMHRHGHGGKKKRKRKHAVELDALVRRLRS